SLAFDPANEGDGAVRRESLAFDPANEGDGAVRRESLAFDPADEKEQIIRRQIEIQNRQIGIKYRKFNFKKQSSLYRQSYSQQIRTFKVITASSNRQSDSKPQSWHSRAIKLERSRTKQSYYSPIRTRQQTMDQQFNVTLQQHGKHTSRGQTDPLHRNMEIYKGRSVSDEGNQSISEKYTKSCNPSRQLQSTQLIEIKGERGRIEQANSERTRRWKSRRSENRRFEMDQSMFCYTKTGKRKMEKNYRLQDSQQTSLFQSLHHGRHTYTTRIAKAWRLDDKNRLGISISPYNSRQRILTIPRVYSQQQVPLVQGVVLRGETCTINLSQNSPSGNQIDQRSAQSSRSGVLRRNNCHPRRKVEIRINKPEHHQHLEKLWVENINQKVNTRTNLIDNVSRMGNQHGEGTVDDDNRKIEQNQINDCKMEESCLKRNTGQSQIPCEFHWITKLPSALNQERWTPHEENKQSQNLDSTEIFWWKAEVDKNKPIQAIIIQPQPIQSTDASINSWGACLKLLNPEEQILFQGDWGNNWRLSGSNQREAAAILCALRRSDPFLKERQVRSLKIQTDNSSAAFNINRGAAATALAKLVDRTLDTAEKLNIELHT
ncbi:MAG: hypothetical protein EZS28_040461, partial [Streblomastix strix]